MFDPETVQTILAVTPAVICSALVLVVSGLIAPRTSRKENDDGR